MWNMFKLNNLKTPEQRQWRRSGVFILNFEHIFIFFSSFCNYFEQVKAGNSRVNSSNTCYKSTIMTLE